MSERDLLHAEFFYKGMFLFAPRESKFTGREALSCADYKASLPLSAGSLPVVTPPNKLSAEVELDFIDVAPAPRFARFHRFHNRVFGVMEVLGGMFILGGVAAAHVPAFQA
jgi:hypothetical protein